MTLRKLAKDFILFYLKISAKIQLAKISPKIIGIGGASGKTSTAGFIDTILKEKYKVRDTHGKNSETGIPLSILSIKISDYSALDWLKVVFTVPLRLIFDWKKYDYLVAEMGIDGPNPPNNMGHLLSILRPKTAVLTNITYEHSLNFETEASGEGDVLPLIAKEELKLLESLSAQDRAIVNIDDSHIRNDLKNIKSEKISVSSSKQADFRIGRIDISQKSFVVEFSFQNRNHILKIKQPLPSYFAYSFILAIATCYVEGIAIKDAVSALEENFVLPPGRAGLFNGIKVSTIIDSSYNSSLEPALGMLDLLKTLAGDKRKVAIIGDIRELGKASKKLHSKLAQKIIETSDFCILVGSLTEEFIAPILKESNFEFKHFKNFTELQYRLPDMIEEGDFILVKASQNTLLFERIVEILLEDKKDVVKLARRGDFWDKVRSTTP